MTQKCVVPPNICCVEYYIPILVGISCKYVGVESWLTPHYYNLVHGGVNVHNKWEDRVIVNGSFILVNFGLMGI